MSWNPEQDRSELIRLGLKRGALLGVAGLAVNLNSALVRHTTHPNSPQLELLESGQVFFDILRADIESVEDGQAMHGFYNPVEVVKNLYRGYEPTQDASLRDQLMADIAESESVVKRSIHLKRVDSDEIDVAIGMINRFSHAYWDAAPEGRKIAKLALLQTED